MSTTTDTTTTRDYVSLTAAEVRLCAQALAHRYGTQASVDSYVNGWLLDLLRQFVSPTAQRDGIKRHPVMGAHAVCLIRCLAMYDEADGIPAGWRLAATQMWHRLSDARRDAQRAGHAD